MRDPHRLVLPATPAEIAKYHLNLGWETASLHGESSRVLNVNGNPCGTPAQLGYPSNYQALPADADTLLRWLGGGAYPAGWGLANVLAIYLCDTASPLVDSLGLGPNLVAAGGPLTGRECVGLGQAGSFTSKVGVEFIDNSVNRFVSGDAAFMNVAVGQIKSFLLVLRFNWNALTALTRIIGKEVAPLWTLVLNGPGSLALYGPAYAVSAVVLVPWTDEAWHSVVGVLDCVANVTRLRTDQGDAVSAPFVGDLVNAGFLRLGQYSGNATGCQIAYLACTDLEITSAMRAAFWRHAQLWTPFTHARLNPLIAPIAVSRVAAWAGGNVGQAAVSYDASLVTAPLGNPLGSGYVCEDGATFEPIGSDDFYGNSITGGSPCVLTSVDGPSRMRDGMRVTMGAAWGAAFAWTPALGTPIVGASNVPWRLDLDYRRALVGTTARAGYYFTGSGGGPEFFTVIADAASPADWGRNGGTATPANADQTAFYVVTGAAANLDDCDFGEPAVIKNRLFANLAWRRVGTAAAAATTTPSVTVVNTNNYVYNPFRGRQELTIGDFQGTAGATFLRFGVPGAAGALCLDYNAGQLRLRIWDAAAALAVTVNGGAVNANRHRYAAAWDSQVGVATLSEYNSVTREWTVLGAWAGAWTSAPGAVTPLYYGSNGGANAARCFIEQV